MINIYEAILLFLGLGQFVAVVGICVVIYKIETSCKYFIRSITFTNKETGEIKRYESD